MLTEKEILKKIMIVAPTLNMRLFRNNCGVLKTKEGCHLKYGVANPGGADLIGWTRIGTHAIFTAIEVKRTGGRPTARQAAFLAAVTSAGGLAVLASSVADVIEAYTKWPN